MGGVNKYDPGQKFKKSFSRHYFFCKEKFHLRQKLEQNYQFSVHVANSKDISPKVLFRQFNLTVR